MTLSPHAGGTGIFSILVFSVFNYSMSGADNSVISMCCFLYALPGSVATACSSGYMVLG